MFPKMASMPSKAQTVKLSTNVALLHSKMAPNTTSFVHVAAPCANWTLMGLATHLNHDIARGFTNECVALESKIHNNPLVPTLNLNKIKFGPNLATFVFAINSPCA
jgi:hypothetical protein